MNFLASPLYLYIFLAKSLLLHTHTHTHTHIYTGSDRKRLRGSFCPVLGPLLQHTGFSLVVVCRGFSSYGQALDRTGSVVMAQSLSSCSTQA